MGIAFALLALLSWGFGDFLIQRGARKFGDWVLLFYIETFVVIVLLPFVFAQIPKAVLNIDNLIIFIGAGAVFVFASISDFEALKLGKLSAMEPIYAFEIPITALLAFTILGERLTLLQTCLILCSMLGIILVSMRSSLSTKGIHLERGIFYASLATLGFGTANFLLGFGARATSPLLINWFTSLFIAIVTFAYLAATGRKKEIWEGLRADKKLILGTAFVDNLAWIAFTYSVLFIPIAVATGISEVYVALAAFLGLVLNREKLNSRQWVGFFLAIVSVITLAFVTNF